MRFLLSLALAHTLMAQWPSYPLSGAPRKADGTINMAAPAPKTADGKPDLSGVWNRATPPPGFTAPRGTVGLVPFQNLPALLPDGLPLKPEAAEIRAKRLANNSKDHPDANCLPLHPFQLHSHIQPRKLVQTPTELVMIYESNNGLRQVFMDGRTLPKDDVQPWWYGYSVGKWDGDTLVVESTGFRDDGWLDEQGTPGSDALKMTERLRRINYGTLEIEITVNDPKTFTKPWTVKLYQALMADTELIEFECAENNTSIKHYVGK